MAAVPVPPLLLRAVVFVAPLLSWQARQNFCVSTLSTLLDVWPVEVLDPAA
jgi:hypothetical protein